MQARTNLVNTSELEVDIEVLLIERLETRVEKAGERGGRGLLDHLGSSSLGIMVGRHRTQPVDVHRVISFELVVAERAGEMENMSSMYGRRTDSRRKLS